jgi:hypothetical protein
MKYVQKKGFTKNSGRNQNISNRHFTENQIESDELLCSNYCYLLFLCVVRVLFNPFYHATKQKKLSKSQLFLNIKHSVS